MSSDSGINSRRAYNSAHPCAVQHCGKRRRGLSGYCAHHERARNLYGSPHGYRVSPQWYASERKEVFAFLTQHKDHRAIHIATEMLIECLEGASEGRPMAHCGQWLRLQSAGVTARDILTEVGALFLYTYRRPNSLPDDDRLTYALGTAVLHLAPRTSSTVWVNGHRELRYARLGGKPRKAFGESMRECFALLFLQMYHAMEEGKRKKVALREALEEPFSV